MRDAFDLGTDAVKGLRSALLLVAFSLPKVRTLLDLVTGVITRRSTAGSMDKEVQPIIRAVAMEFGVVRVLRGRKYGAQALAKECRIIPRSKWRTTVQWESEADRGGLPLRVMGVSIELPVPVMVDWLMGFTPIQNSFEGNCLGLVFGCDGAAMTGKTGVVATSMWMLNLPKLPQSANHTFTVMLSNGEDKSDSLRVHGMHQYGAFSHLAHDSWEHPTQLNTTTGERVRICYMVFRNGDGKEVRLAYGLCSAAGEACCCRCTVFASNLRESKYWFTVTPLLYPESETRNPNPGTLKPKPHI